jgi:hypothetical protein
VFAVDFQFTEKDHYFSDLYLTGCRNNTALFNAACTMASPILDRLLDITSRLDQIHSSFIGEEPVKRQFEGRFHTSSGKNRGGRTRTSAEPLMDVSKADIENLVEEQGRRKRAVRPQRQILLAAAAGSFIGNKIFSYFGTSSSGQEIYDHLQSRLDSGDKNMVRLANSINFLRDRVNVTMANVVEKFNTFIKEEQNETNLHLQSLYHGELRSYLLLAEALQEQMRLVEEFHYSLILSACTSSQLSPLAVKQYDLHFELLTLWDAVDARGFDFVIPVTDPSSWYHHPLATCQINTVTKEIAITLTVPIRLKSTKYELIEVVTVPFLHRPSSSIAPDLCRINLEHNLVVRINKTSLVPISQAQLPHCSVNKHFCFFNEYSSTPLEPLDCLKALLLGTTAEELMEICPIHCRRAGTKEISIVNVGDLGPSGQLFAVTNAPNDTVVACTDVNTGNDTKIRLMGAQHSIGSYLVHLTNCHCRIEFPNRTPVKASQPCIILANSSSTNTVSVIIPSRWTNINPKQIKRADYATLDLSQKVPFPNISAIYNPAWFKRDPIITPPSRDLKKYLQFSEHYSQYYDHYLTYVSLMWNTIITLVIICLWFKLVVSALGQRVAVAAFPQVRYAAALSDSELDHKINVLLATIGSLSLIIFLAFLLAVFICLKKWKIGRYQIKCVQGDPEEADNPYFPTQQPLIQALAPNQRPIEVQYAHHPTYPSLNA